MLTKKQLIEKFNLEPLSQEGGYYRRIYESAGTDSHARRYCASIYYLLESPDFSCFHRLDCDELWHFYAGDALVLHQIQLNGELLQIDLGNPLQHDDVTPFALVKKGAWFAAEVKKPDGYCLVGCTTTPEFLFNKFEAASCQALSEKYPQHQALIARLTRQ